MGGGSAGIKLFLLHNLALYMYLLGLLYYTLGNIVPKLRSTIQSIQLLSVVKDTFVRKYGIDAILAPFVDEVKLLEGVSSNKAVVCTL